MIDDAAADELQREDARVAVGFGDDSGEDGGLADVGADGEGVAARGDVHVGDGGGAD